MKREYITPSIETIVVILEKGIAISVDDDFGGSSGWLDENGNPIS
jgi:hypothetical protein